MVASSFMRDSLLHPVLFLLLTLLCLVLFAAGYLVYLWDIQYLPSSVPSLSWAVKLAPQALHTAFVPAVISGLFLLIVRIARRPGVPFLSFLLPFAAAVALLYFGIVEGGKLVGPLKPPTPRIYNPLLPHHFNRVGSKIIYPMSVDGAALGPTLVIDPGAKTPFTLEPGGSFNSRSWSASFAGGKLSIPIRPHNPSLTEELAPRGFLAQLISDAEGMNTFLARAGRGPRRELLIAVGGIALFAAGCIGLAWATRWPLVNVFLVAVAFRALFWLFRLFSDPAATSAFSVAVPSPYLGVSPSVGLGAVGVLFLLWTILFIRPPARE